MKEKSAGTKKRWDWLPDAMPEVAKRMAEQRLLLGDAMVQACWHAGVVQGLPGFYFAAEGALSLGTPTAAQALEWFDLDPLPGMERPSSVLLLADTATVHAWLDARKAAHAGA